MLSRSSSMSVGCRAVGDQVGDEPLVAGDVLAGDDGDLAHGAGAAASTASISPSSMRKPRILTCWSMRPRYSSSPSARRRARSPVRYMRALGRCERIGHEALRGQLRAAAGSRGHAGAADVDLAGHAVGTGSPCASSR